MERRYDIRDLAQAQVSAVRYANKHVDLAGFHAARFRAFAAAFGASDKVEVEKFGSNPLEGLAASTISTLAGLHSPFSGYMEAPEEIVALSSRFGDAINDAVAKTAEALLDLLCGVLAELHGIPEDRTIGHDDLLASGFDPSTPWPDEFDYW